MAENSKVYPNYGYALEVVQGVEGIAVYVNGLRIAGPKPWGGGKKIATYAVQISDLLSAVPTLTIREEK